MKKLALIQALIFVATLWGWDPSPANALSIRDRILNEISVRSVDDYSVIKIGFNFPVRYVRHYPVNYGKEVRIEFEPIVASREDREGLQKRESLFPPANNPVGVARVEYEGRNQIQPTLTVIFNQPTSFEAKQGEDFRSLIVLVPLKKTDSSQKPAAGPTKEAAAAATQKTEKTAAPSSAPGTLTPERQESLQKEGVEVMASKNYSRAIQIYTKLLESVDPEVQEQAQFQLALAREYNGHLAHAKAEYRNYLTNYPEGPNTEMAHDRLKALLSARPLGATSTLASQESLWENELYGSLSQFFDWDESFSDEDDDDDETVNISSMTTSFDATWHLRNERFQLETVIIGSQELDLQNERGDETRLSALYLDFEDAARTITTRWGRQSGNSGGVLGRFDGGRFGYLLTEKVRMNLVAGFPVNLSSDGLETDRYFYGINFDLGRFAEHWDFNVYAINQIADGITDRRAIGGEVRYLGSRGSFFTLLDYDILFKELNILLFTGNWLTPNNKTQLTFSADFRKSPILSTSNGLIGQVSPSLEILRDSIGESSLRKLAQDRTLDSSFVTIGASHPLSENLQIAGDISWSKLDGGAASGGVDEIESTGNEFFYSAQLIGNSLLKQGDISSIGLRYADTKQRDTYTLNLNTRYPVNEALRVNPKLQIDYRVNKEQSGDQWRFRPSVLVDYVIHDSWRLEFESGFSYANDELGGVAEDTFGYFVSVGLRWDF
ncbi:MAG: hypothetical protein WBB23_11195 [Desulforhopalus sp.]